MKIKMLVATGNPGKLEEVRRIIGGEAELLSFADFPDMSTPEETGSTFAENAAIKAEAAATFSGIAALADDSGLSVDALGGEPGVRSARYGAPQAVNDKERYELLLRKLADVPEGMRKARFVSAVALALPGQGTVAVTEGTCEGTVIEVPRGENGFGYDPVFVPEGYDRSYAELTGKEKDEISHRRRALEAIVPILREIARKTRA